MATTMLPHHSRDFMEVLSPEDFETASIRSAAPSYSSETPSTHYTVPNHAGGSLPPYAPPERVPGAASSNRHNSVPSAQSAPMASSARRAGSASAASGLPSIASYGLSMDNDIGRRGEMPNLSQFRIPSWSSISSNPNARLYHSVALRRVAAAEHASAAAEIGGLMRRLAILERAELAEAVASARNGANNSGNARIGSSQATTRPLEDPHLVGEAAARRTRAARLARDTPAPADDALIREDRRWDWFLGSFARPSNVPSSRHGLSLAPRRHIRLHPGFIRCQMKGRHRPGWSQSSSRIRRQFDVTRLPAATMRHIRTGRL
ncbi:hypothetical protein CMQ_4721 [Grosmannia clavigera kw1407]|uniref:Uncharacterized protein n=1 Tax=Grosmannia clavigera (strain kw1407 / UAMH 11150) TaxID=655863 RepID=F0XUP1_GROCL|nr:uncharacterized protein CMQ_4721 [Grosmannia clavigera kw1407]EFW98869.1 hypothetical protein CMQ_4721 [Grosmannia clavigera kw1407]